MSTIASPSYSIIDPETGQLIEAVLKALAKSGIPAIVVLPADDVVERIAAFARLCLLHNATDSKRRRN